MTHTFIDLFAGIGGFHLGFKKSGYKCLMASDINDNARKTYFDNHGILPMGDITKIHLDDIPYHDVLTAGFPCQPFSICGKKKVSRIQGEQCFFIFVILLNIKNPKLFFLRM